VVATALIAAVGNANEFKSGRELSAWLGLVPRQHSSGNRNVLLGISKRGDRYLRTLLIHGARSALCRAERRSDRRSIWASRLKLARGFNVAAVALANKNARTIWALLTRGENYRPAAIPDQASKAERTAAFHHRPPTTETVDKERLARIRERTSRWEQRGKRHRASAKGALGSGIEK